MKHLLFSSMLLLSLTTHAQQKKQPVKKETPSAVTKKAMATDTSRYIIEGSAKATDWAGKIQMVKFSILSKKKDWEEYLALGGFDDKQAFEWVTLNIASDAVSNLQKAVGTSAKFKPQQDQVISYKGIDEGFKCKYEVKLISDLNFNGVKWAAGEIIPVPTIFTPSSKNGL